MSDLQVLVDSQWKKFVPLILYSVGETVDNRKYEDLQDKVYGKFVCGTVGFRVAWQYQTFDKSQVRENQSK
jgi:hypothetical protein